MFNNDKNTFAQHYAEQSNKQQDAQAEPKEREMADDPMLDYFREQERAKQGGDSKVYKDWYPPNRYNIRPGHKWDGVDRSNGYERRLMDRGADEADSYRLVTRDL